MEITQVTNEYILIKITTQVDDEFEFRINSNSHNYGFDNAEHMNGITTILHNQRICKLLVTTLGNCTFGYSINYANLHTLQPIEKTKLSEDNNSLKDLFTGNFVRALSFNRGAMLWRFRPARNGGMYFSQDCIIKDGNVITGMDHYSSRVIRVNDANFDSIKQIIDEINQKT